MSAASLMTPQQEQAAVSSAIVGEAFDVVVACPRGIPIRGECGQAIALHCQRTRDGWSTASKAHEICRCPHTSVAFNHREWRELMERGRATLDHIIRRADATKMIVEPVTLPSDDPRGQTFQALAAEIARTAPELRPAILAGKRAFAGNQHGSAA